MRILFYRRFWISLRTLSKNWIESNTKVVKVRYSLGGILMDYVIDYLDGNCIVRHINNYEFIENGLVTKSRYNMNLIPIKRKKLVSDEVVENQNIGVIDTETINCRDSITRVYCLGFKTNLAPKDITYCVDLTKFRGDNYDMFDEVVLKLTNELLRSKYEDTTFYCHNIGDFDIVFILGVIYRYNESHPDSQYNLNLLFRDKTILKITISKIINKN